MFILESLPNELIIELFKYLNTRELFQSFYNLNYHFNYLIQSVNHLIYSTNNNNKDLSILSYPYIRTLIIDNKFDEKLNYFPNIHRLILDYITDDLISQLNTYNLPNLEYISINYKVHPFYMSILRRKIFSNTFPNLKYCYISRMKPACTIHIWTQTLSLRFLKLNDINILIYTSILSACPNLYFFKFKLFLKTKIQSNIVLHNNLKQLIINMNYNEWPWDDNILEDYFLCVPNIEYLKISRTIRENLNIIDKLKYYDWFSSLISSHLILLYRFHFNLYITRSNELIDFNVEEISQDLKKKFNNIYKNLYQYRLLVF